MLAVSRGGGGGGGGGGRGGKQLLNGVFLSVNSQLLISVLTAGK